MGLLGKLGRVFINTSEYYFNFNYEKKSHSETENVLMYLTFTWFCHDGTIPYLCILATHGYANYR